MKQIHISDSAVKVGGTLVASAMLGLGLPSVASAQTQDAPSWYTQAATGAAATQGQQLDRLEGDGFLSPDQIAVEQVDPSQASALGPVPQDKLQSALDDVKVNTSLDSGADSLRQYLATNGVDPSSVVGVLVAPDGSVTILHS